MRETILPTADTTLVTLGRLLHGMTRRYQSVEAENAPSADDRDDRQTYELAQLLAY